MIFKIFTNVSTSKKYASCSDLLIDSTYLNLNLLLPVQNAAMVLTSSSNPPLPHENTNSKPIREFITLKIIGVAKQIQSPKVHLHLISNN